VREIGWKEEGGEGARVYRYIFDRLEAGNTKTNKQESVQFQRQPRK